MDRPPDRNEGGKKRGSWRGRGGRGGGYWRGGRGGFKSSEGGSNPGGPGSGSVAKGPAFALGQESSWMPYLSLDDINDPTVQMKIQAVKNFIARDEAKSDGDRVLHIGDQDRSFSLNHKLLVRDTLLKNEWPRLQDDLLNNATRVFGIVGYGFYKKFREEQTVVGETPPLIFPRLTGFSSEKTRINKLRSSDVGKLVTLKGTCIRVENIAQLNTWLAFLCDRCDNVCSVEQKPKGKYTRPIRCPHDGCKSQTFTPQRSDPGTLTADSQNVRLQEMETSSNGRVPRTLDCFLVHDLCDSVKPGDVATFTGVVRVLAETEGGVRASNKFSIYLEVLSVAGGSTSSRRRSASGGGGRNSTTESKSNLEFTSLDFEGIQQLHAEGNNLFKLLVASLCPSIYGHEYVKAGLLLSMFGGMPKFANDKTHVAVRGDIHVLVVGDPGLGKSQMLQSCHLAAPRSVFVTATGATATGLTVTMTKGAGNEFILEAGALVLADQGCCCIDEFDKMTNQHPALLEAMEQQSISLAKSGVSCSLPARTSILAAANPIGGHYNKAKTVAENLRMSPALLSRFDLVFILIDKPNEDLDLRLSDHIMNLHGGSSRSSLVNSTSCQASGSLTSIASDGSLLQRLMTDPGEDLETVPPELIRKYIAYARKYVKPKLSVEAGKEIQEFYLKLRESHHCADATPITTRQLESVMRLTEARAKVELREVATGQDAREVIEIMKESMRDTFTDEAGGLDFSRSLHGSGMSRTGPKKKFVANMMATATRQNKKIFSVDDMKQIAMSVGLDMLKFHETLTSLNDQGYILKMSSNQYKLLSFE